MTHGKAVEAAKLANQMSQVSLLWCVEPCCFEGVSVSAVIVDIDRVVCRQW